MNFTRINPAILMIVILVLLVLLSACANLGNMLVARGLARQREITIRFAVGAGRGRLVRQLMTENFLLATLGCAAGLFVGHAGASWLLHTLDAPPDIRVATDWQTLTVGVACIFVSALAFGLPAALHVVRSDHKSSLRRQILVGLQVAVSCLLLISSTVLTHGAIRSATVNLSFDSEKLMVVYPQIYSKHLPPPVARQRLDALVTRLMTLAGVDSVTTATIPPLSGRRAIETLPDLPPIYTNYVGPSYFNTMEIGVLRGRSFLPSDQDSAIVSESAARAIWPNQDPLGKTLAFGPIKRTIIGIVKDSGANLPADPRSVEMYFPIDATTVDGSALILRSKGDPAPLLRPVHSECAGLEEQVTSILMRTTRERSLDEQKDTITIIGSLGLIATLLATTGMFALMAFRRRAAQARNWHSDGHRRKARRHRSRSDNPARSTDRKRCHRRDTSGDGPGEDRAQHPLPYARARSRSNRLCRRHWLFSLDRCTCDVVARASGAPH